MKLLSGIKKIPVFFSEVKQELKNVSWSTKEELLGATWAVITLTFLLSCYVGVVDLILSKFLTTVLK